MISVYLLLDFPLFSKDKGIREHRFQVSITLMVIVEKKGAPASFCVTR